MGKWWLLSLIFVAVVPVLAQQEAAIWYFGRNAGLDFNSGTPVALTNGQLNTYEGSSSISDSNGNLLFYTDGITVWNRNHVPMPNGTGLLGDPSSTQSGIIVPKPGNPNTYYIFTVGDSDNPVGMHYSEVDMIQGGGFGTVVNKNAPLISPTSEKLTAVQHANGTDYWVITHGWENQAFYAFLVSSAGVSTTPVTSNVGIDLANPGPGKSTRNAIGYLKVSPDGTKLAAAHSNIGAEMFTFDPSTGIVSNAIALSNERGVYGIEFSPDSAVLYLSYIFYVGFNYQLRANVYQYDVSSNSEVAIQASATLVSPIQTTEIGALQLGIDGKIYVAQYDQTYLGVINNPNALGVGCNYVENGVALAGRQSSLGLPPFIQSFFLSGILAQNFCLGDTTEFSVTSSDPILNIIWDFGDGNTSTLENPTHTYATSGTYTVNVTVTTASDTANEIKDIVITDTPVAYTPSDIEICSTTSESFDFSLKDAEVLGAQSAMDFRVSYHTSQTDAELGGNALPNPYTNTNALETIYARISSLENPSCHDVSSFNILVKLAPELNVVNDWIACDDNGDGLFTFDLSTKDVEILNGQDVGMFTITYHRSQTDADSGANTVGPIYVNSLPMETLFFRIGNSVYPECFETGSFTIAVIEQVVANQPNDLEICDADNDESAIFDFTMVEGELVGTQDPSNLLISYHDSQSDADTGINALPTNYLSTTTQKTIYVRVANASDTSCYDTTSFQATIFATPVAPTILDWWVCDDDNDGQYQFDLNEKTTEIFDSNGNGEISFYVSEQDAELAQNAITGINAYQNTENPQTIYFRLQNSNNLNCHDVGQFQLQVFDAPTAHEPVDIVVCDDAETGSYSFNLSQKDVEILNGQDGLVYEVTYYTTELDAYNATNAVKKGNYVNVDLIETLYARVQHALLDICYDVVEFSLTVNSLPQLELEDTYVICLDHPDLIVDAGLFESYLWKDAQGNTVGSQRTLQVTELGTYTVTVTQTTNGVTCEKSDTFEVVSSGAPDSFTVATSGLSDRITLDINAIGIGDFEYSIDGISFQSNNQFDVFPGKYTVYVRDPYGCRTLTDTVYALGYQRFFTPNGDGVHESWNIIGANEFPGSRIFIYDRFGKLLQQISPEGPGWDGKYLGRPLPASDYWFKFEHGEGEVMTGHFALKR
ncbi:MAG: T9SS type B sorting domain-containing protein [Bacteroidota bacterium]|nr:T9SS type B sorting domain-containing protein [Bacteroidota bacterium]